MSMRSQQGFRSSSTTVTAAQEVPCHQETAAIGSCRVQEKVKRLLDLALTLSAAPFVFPLIGFLACLVKLQDGGPSFYRRRVIGRHGPFDAFKIRTMRVDAEEILASDPKLEEEFKKQFKLADDPRITRSGRILRRYNLDELPQFWNVLRGEMSLVGPRMKTAEEFARYGEAAAKVLSVKPGITGYWQVTGRHRISYAERVQLDLRYVSNWSLWLDLTILLRTVRFVLSGRGD